MRLPGGKGYETRISQDRLSAGERQRIALARVLLRIQLHGAENMPLLMLDEVTNGIDDEDGQLINTSLQAVVGTCTTLIITHHLETIKQANQILVFKHGEIIERGTHHELLAANGWYAHAWNERARLYEPSPPKVVPVVKERHSLEPNIMEGWFEDPASYVLLNIPTDPPYSDQVKDEFLRFLSEKKITYDRMSPHDYDMNTLDSQPVGNDVFQVNVRDMGREQLQNIVRQCEIVQDIEFKEMWFCQRTRWSSKWLIVPLWRIHLETSPHPHALDHTPMPSTSLRSSGPTTGPLTEDGALYAPAHPVLVPSVDHAHSSISANDRRDMLYLETQYSFRDTWQ
jgi:hypothetical protein